MCRAWRPRALCAAAAAAGLLALLYMFPPAVDQSTALPVPLNGVWPGCPSGRLVTINPTGRLGNKLCQYASLWALQRRHRYARPAYILPEMHEALAPLAAGLRLLALSAQCARHAQQFWSVSFFNFGEHSDSGTGPASAPVLLRDHPCMLTEFHRYRDELADQLRWQPAVLLAAQRQLRRLTAGRCPPDSSRRPCTYVGVHVRRTDYDQQVRSMLNGTLVGSTYLRRALAHCRRRYGQRTVFVVASDDLAWCRQQQLARADDVVLAEAGGSAAADLALLSQCNHTVMTHGTYGFWAAYLAGGHVVVPTGFSGTQAYMTTMMLQMEMDMTKVPAN